MKESESHEASFRKVSYTIFTTKEQGTGLGLALVKKVIDEHNGNIKVESTLDVGTTFIIELPVYVEGLKEYFDDEENEKLDELCSYESIASSLIF